VRERTPSMEADACDAELMGQLADGRSETFEPLTVAEILKGAKIGHIAYVPGELDIIGDSKYLERFGKGTNGEGWYSFNHRGVHFLGLVNVASQGMDSGLGILGPEQLGWLKADLAAPTDSTPVVVFAHVPLLRTYPRWGWGTQDGQQALSYLKRFGSVTVLNGHIHQIFQKVEGNVTFHDGAIDGLPAAGTGQGGRPGSAQEYPGREVARHARPDECELPRGPKVSRRDRLDARVGRAKSDFPEDRRGDEPSYTGNDCAN
jgi:3',5'-cyclic AMP phosphodiesterase CpdA